MNLHGPRAEGPLPARVAKACVNCHKSKTRCDGREPTCSPCADKGRECAYPKRDGGGSSGGGGDNDARRVSPPTSHPVEQVNVVQDAVLTMESMDVDVSMDAMVPSLPIMDMDMDMAANTSSDPSVQIADQQHMASMAGYPQFIPLPPDLETQMQPPLAAPTPPPPPNALQDLRNQQLAETYFTVFHPHWPIIHRGTFMSNQQPELLTRAVMIIGLFFQGSAEARALAVQHHRKLLKEAQDKVVRWNPFRSFLAPLPDFEKSASKQKKREKK